MYNTGRRDQLDSITYNDGTSGKLGFVYNGVPYYYIRNVLGDVKGILDANGNLVAEYKYDAWGNCTVTLDTLGVGAINPIRYRGYYYDTETGLYYLQTRYYDPEIGRFISPDNTKYLDPETLGGLNLYAYCNNNPVMYADPSGCVFITASLVIASISALALGSTMSALSQAAQYGFDNISLAQVLIDGAFASASVILAATGIPQIASALIGAGMGISQYVLSTRFHNEESITLSGIVISGALGFVGGWFSGAGANNKTSILKNNLYAYCNNNPVMYADPSGNIPRWLKTGLVVLAGIAVIAGITAVTLASGGLAAPVLFGAGLGTLLSGGVSAAMQFISTGSINWDKVIIDATVGGVMGAFGASAISQYGMSIAGATTGFVSSIAEDWVEGSQLDLIGALNSALLGGLFAFKAGAGKQYSSLLDSIAIKDTMHKISTQTGSWTKGLKKIYANRLKDLRHQIISDVKGGVWDDVANNCTSYFYSFFI